VKKDMKKDKKEKLIHEEEKKTRVLVKETFNAEKSKSKTNPMVENLVKSVLLNRRMVKRDKKANKKWQDTYYQHLFLRFKDLINSHNENFGININKLDDKITDRKRVLKMLEDKIDKAKLELRKTKKDAKIPKKGTSLDL
jgi:hypothetical protein